MITSVKLLQSWQWRQFVVGHYCCHHEHLFLIVDIIRFFFFYLDISPILTPKIGVVYEGRGSRELDKQPESLLLVFFPIWASWNQVIHGCRFNRCIRPRSSCFDIENPKAKQQGSARRSKKGAGCRESFRDPVVDEKSRLITQLIWSSFSRAHGLIFEHWTHFRFPISGALSREPTSQRAHRELALKESERGSVCPGGEINEESSSPCSVLDLAEPAHWDESLSLIGSWPLADCWRDSFAS